MNEMTGTCPYCGQTRLVSAYDQHDADVKAAELCNCDNVRKRRRQCIDNIETICGETAKDFGFSIVTEEIKDLLKDAGSLCILEHFESMTLRVADSTVVIKRTKSGVAVQRKKTSTATLEA